MATYHELVAQKAALEKQAAELQEKIAAAHQAERSEAVTRIKALMREHGVTLAELGGGKAGARAPTKTKVGGTARKKVPAKYRNPATGDTWSGRGLQPNWLKAELARGRKIEDFAL